MQRLIRAVNSIASRAGITILPTGQIRDFNFVQLLQRIFSEHGIEYVVDVGANSGQYGQWLRDEIHYAGQIESFEPMSSAFARLKSAAAGDSRWLCRHIALGDKSRDAVLNVMAEDSFSSLHAPSIDGTRHYQDMNSVKQTEMVEVVRLDSRNLPEKFYLKIDTQGHEIAVLDGASAVIDRVPACQIEISNINIYEGVPGIAGHLQYMEGIGFSLVGLFPVSQIHNALVVDFDGVFVNRRHCS